MMTFKELKRSLKKDTSSLPAVRLAVIGDTATQLLCTAVCGTGVERGFRIELFEAEYNQVERQLLDPSSELYSFDADFIVLFQSTHKLGERHSMLDAAGQAALSDERMDFLTSVCENSALKGKKIICFNYPEIDDTVFGSYAAKVESSFTFQVRKLNFELMQLSRRQPDFFICDIAALQNKFGRDRMFAPNVYTSTEMVLSLDALPYVAGRVMDIVCAVKGQFKKCLILDLDNTLWGGVIGDDGLEGIQLGHSLGIGKAFTEFQMWVRKLKQRGIIICVASKNNEDTAKEPFEKHPDMVLRLDDIAVFQANWETKVDNIRTIQSILNIGFDSMVFLDDNPFERSIVRENIPGITVPELPEDPAEYLEYLYSLNLFETASYSSLDKDRTKQYQVEAQRVSLSRTFTDEADFLKSLDMVSVVSGFTKFNTPRVAQLSQRSNQFNLRTVRYTDADIERIAADSGAIGISFTLEDKFGDNGLIAVVIMTPEQPSGCEDSDEAHNAAIFHLGPTASEGDRTRLATNTTPEQPSGCEDSDEAHNAVISPSEAVGGGRTLFVDTWLMSCRVLKRGMENFTLNQMVLAAKAKGYRYIIGEYLPTLKNSMVKDHYRSLGFEELNGADTSRWILDVERYEERECYIKRKEL